ncbi:MAG: transglycosylase domain-containing protein [Bacteroidota bacterium]
MSLKEYFFNSRFRKLFMWMWVGIFSALTLFGILIMFVSWGWFGELPALEELENPKTYLASEIYSEDGVLLGKYYLQNRSNASFNEISPNVFNALIATEDIRFYDHPGIDFRGASSIVLYAMIGKKRGASTITQQLAKNLFPRKKFDNVINKATTKLKEWITAVRIEQRYTKEEIITMYLNTVEFGGNAFGIRSASKTFFGKQPSELEQNEAALLVGMLKGITKFNPIRNAEKALSRRNTVLEQMNKYDFISDAAYDTLSKKPIVLNYQEEDHNEGLAPYFREHLRMELLQWCEDNGYNLYKDGLKIYTTINSKMQLMAEQSVHQHLSDMQRKFYNHWKGKEPWGRFTELITAGVHRSDRYRILKLEGKSEDDIMKEFNKPVHMKVFSYTRGEIDTVMTPLDSVKYYKYFLQCGFMSMDPTTGYVKAWVGGINHKYFKYDHVNINSKRQVGSTFKPIVYTLAMDNGWSPCFIAPNQPVQFEGYPDYDPQNADGKYDQPEMTLYRGLQFSVNRIVMFIMKQLGPNAPQSVIELARKMGIKSDLPPYPSIALGTADLSVYEMVGAYSTFANKGVWTEPIYLKQIVDKKGNVVKVTIPKTVEAISEPTAYIMEKMLERVTAHGTAAKIKYQYLIPGAVGGKTGTTQSYSDGWFIGITPSLVSGCWVGCEDRAVHFRSMDLGAGGAMAMPIWGYYMQKITADKTLFKIQPEFELPKQPITVEMNCDEYNKEDVKKLELIEE